MAKDPVSHQPFEKLQDGDTLVLFVHGFAGSPNQFRNLAALAYRQGCSVSSVLLPGHGGSCWDFCRCRGEQWSQHLQQKLEQYRKAYPNILLVGHSMGGLLCLNASLIEEIHIKGILAIAAPIRIRVSPRFLTMSCRFLMHRHDQQPDEIMLSYVRSHSIQDTPIYLYPLWLKQIYYLQRLMGQTRANLPQVTVPVVFIYSQKDELAPPKNYRWICQGLTRAPHKAVILQKSYHAYYPSDEQAIIEQQLSDMIRLVQQNGKV